MFSKTKIAVAIAAGLVAAAPAVNAQDAGTVKIGVVTFLSGPAAGPFGVPARNAAELTFELLNAGKVPAPYQQKGLGGAKIEMHLLDEAGTTTTQVTEFRNMVQRTGVDVVVGYISSGNCLAIAPVAEELKKLTVFFTCGTPRIFEAGDYKYVFRTASHATSDNVGAAMYVKEMFPKVKKFGGINQNYAWGQDSWNDFSATMQLLVPGSSVTTSQMPKLFAGQYGAEISALLTSGSDVVHSSLWNGDLEAFILQAGPRGLFKKNPVVLTTGETAMYKLAKQIPDGVIIGARGPYGVFAPDNELNRWYSKTYEDRYSVPPNFSSYQMTQSILGLKMAWEKAQAANGGKRPAIEQVIAAFENSTFPSPAGEIKMALGKGHQAIAESVYGMTKKVNGEMTVTNVKRFPANVVNPPEGVNSADWIKGGLKSK